MSSTECDTSTTQLNIFKRVILVSLSVQLYQDPSIPGNALMKGATEFWVGGQENKRYGKDARLGSKKRVILISLGGQEYPGRN